MGGNASPLLADLTLSTMEYKYLKSNPIPTNIPLFRYIDDILAINIDMDTKNEHIYDDSLQLNKETMLHNGISYLDLKISANTSIMLYDKTDDFPFKVKKFFDKNSCVHSKMMNGIITGRLLNAARKIATIDSWKVEVKKLISTLLDNKYSKTDIIAFLTNYHSKYPNTIWRYGIFSKKQFLKIILPLVT